MTQIALNIKGIENLKKKVSKMLNRLAPKAALISEVTIKFGVTTQDMAQKTDNFLRAQRYYTMRLKKQKRRELFLRKYRRRGEMTRKSRG